MLLHCFGQFRYIVSEVVEREQLRVCGPVQKSLGTRACRGACPEGSRYFESVSANVVYEYSFLFKVPPPFVNIITRPFLGEFIKKSFPRKPSYVDQ